MSYELSVSPEFFFAEGEPYDGGPELPTDRPISVWSAIESMRLKDPRAWDELARDVFGIAGELLPAESVLDKIEETKTVANLDSPVRVYIDEECCYWVEVYDER